MKTGLKWISLFLVLLQAACSSDGDSLLSPSGSSSGTGLAGSLARFAVAGKTLYCVNGRTLSIYDVNDQTSPVYLSKYNMNREVETIFVRDSVTMFIGTTTGMFVLDISNRTFPKILSFNSHIRSRDPVVASDSFAYVTLRSQDSWGANQLDIFDIRNLSAPTLVRTYPLTGPYGLALAGNRLLVCDEGIKVFDITDAMDMQFLSAYSGKIYDLIRLDHTFITVGAEGMQQFSLQNDSLIYLSSVK